MPSIEDLLYAQSALHYGLANQQRAKVGLPTLQPLNKSIMTKLLQEGFNWDFTPKGYKPPKQPTGFKGSAISQAIGTDKAELLKQMADQTKKIKAAGTPGKSILSRLGDVGMGGLHGLGKSLDYLSRPGKFVTSGFYAATHPEEFGVSGANFGELIKNANKKAAGAFIGKDKDTKTGADIIVHTPWTEHMSGGWQKTALQHAGGLAIDVAADPTTYLTLGATQAAEKVGAKVAGKLGAEATAELLSKGVGTTVAEKLVRSIPGDAAQALKDVTGTTVGKATRKLAKGETATAAIKMTQKKSGTQLVQRLANDRAKIRLQEAVANGSLVGPELRKQIMDESVAEITDVYRKHSEKYLNELTKRRTQVKLMGRDVLGNTKVGRAVGRDIYKTAELGGKALGKIPGLESGVKGIRQAFSMSERFPGLMNRVRRGVTTEGVVDAEQWSREIDNAVKGLSDAEQKTVLHNLERGIPMKGMVSESGKDLGQVEDFFNHAREVMFEKQRNAGIYQTTDASSNYVPHYYRTLKSTREDIAKFKSGRKAALRSQGAKSLEPFTIEAAKEAGLKPLERVGDAFKYGYNDSVRKSMLQRFISEAGDKYGFVTKNKEMAKGFTDLTKHVRGDLRNTLDASGESLMMHPELGKAVHAMMEMGKRGNDEELTRLMRMFHKATNAWKSSATLYNPGNWLNNTMGDITLNYIDGVQNPAWYKRAFHLTSDKLKTGTMKIGGYNIDENTLMDLYNKTGKGGFLPFETKPGTFTQLEKVRGGIRGAYERREEVSRMAHWLHSVDQELSKSGAQKGLNVEGKYFTKHLQDAADAAGDRVAKWNIDYSAFTPTEQSIKRNVAPFYSWTRKSIPLLIEAMATKPGRLATIHKVESEIDRMLGGEKGGYNTVFPLWLRDAGYTRLTKGEDPWVVKDPLPTNQLGQFFGGSSMGDFLRNKGAMLHPALRVPIEQMMGKEMFSGRTASSNPVNILASNMPVLNQASMLAGRDLKPGGLDLSPQQQLGMLLGSKPYNISEKTQISELRRQQDTLDYQLRNIEKQAAPFKVRKTSKGYQVYDGDTNYKYSTFSDPGVAQAMALSLSKQRKKK